LQTRSFSPWFYRWVGAFNHFFLLEVPDHHVVDWTLNLLELLTAAQACFCFVHGCGRHKS
jgi:hypothetical protein